MLIEHYVLNLPLPGSHMQSDYACRGSIPPALRLGGGTTASWCHRRTVGQVESPTASPFLFRETLVSSYSSISMIEAADATGWLRGRGAPVRAGAAARGSSGCLRSFPKVRKTASHISRTYLEVPWHMLLLQSWYWASPNTLSHDCRTQG